MFFIRLIGLLCCLAVGNCVGYDIEDRVLVLNDSNFDTAIKEHKHVFATFDVSCIDKCEALVPKFAKAAKQLEEEGSDIKLAKVYTTFKGLLTWKYLHRLPTLMFFRNGHPVYYKGSHTIEEMIQWVKKKTEPPAQILSTVNDARIFMDSAEVTIVGFFKNHTNLEAKEFLKAAYTIDRHAFAITSEDAVYKELGASKDGVMLFKKFDERKNTLALKPTCDKIRTFVAMNSQPLVVQLTEQNINDVLSGPIPLYSLLFYRKNSADMKEVLENLREAAAAFRHQVVEYNGKRSRKALSDFIDINTEHGSAYTAWVEGDKEENEEKEFVEEVYDDMDKGVGEEQREKEEGKKRDEL